VTVTHLHIDASADYQHPDYASAFFDNNWFTGEHARANVQSGHSGYVPVFLSQIPSLMSKGIVPVDVALIQISPPDALGYCSLGVSVDVSIDAVYNAKKVVAHINPNMPRTHGDGVVHISSLDHIYYEPVPIPLAKVPVLSDVEVQIGRNVANLIQDGDCLQMGIGAIPDAVLKTLSDRKNLGLHTEMFSSSVVDLLKKGVINNSQKASSRGISVVSFCRGDQELYDFIHDNPSIQFRRTAYVNDPRIVAAQKNMVAINSAIEIDLTGQVCADSIGPKIFSGIGGQMDFMAGAGLAEGGRPIMALPSTTRKGASRLVAALAPGAGVTTTRGHVHYVVTEYGTAFLFGANLQQRLQRLLEIAHPDHRQQLERDFHDLYQWNGDWKRWYGFHEPPKK